MRSLRFAAWPLLVVGAVLLLLAPGLGPDRLLSWRDSLGEFAPLRPVIAEALRGGRLPLWDPYDGTGVPLFAQIIHGTLHPASLALALVAPDGHLDNLLLAYFLLAALGTYGAARALEASQPAAAAAAVAFAGSGYVLGSAGNLPFLAGSASLPWLVWAGRRLGTGGRLGVTALAVAAAAGALAGDLHALVVGALLALALAADAGGWRALAKGAAGLALGGLLAAVQLIPSWAFVPLTSRSLPMTEAMRTQWSLSPWRLPELVAPGFFAGDPGSVMPRVFRALEPDSQFPMPFAASIFIGVAVLVAAAFATRQRAARPLLVAVPILLWLAFGHRLGAQQLLASVPVWGSLRYAEKLAGPLTLVVALLAAMGVGRLGSRAPARSLGAAAAIAAVLAGAFALDATGTALVRIALPDFAVEAGRSQAAAGLAQLAGGLAALAALAALARRAPQAFAPAFAGLVLLQALAAAPYGLHTTPVHAVRPPTPPAPPPGPRLHTPARRVDGLTGPDGTDVTDERETALGFAGFNVLAREDNVDVYTGLAPLRHDRLWTKLERLPRSWRRYGVTHVVLPSGPLGEVGREAVQGGTLRSDDGAVQVWEVPHRPWAAFAPGVRAVERPIDAISATFASARNDTQEVIVEAPAPPPLAPGRVLRVERGMERVVVDAEAQGQALLVVNDAFWPGWVAEIDGAPATILPADAMVRAVPFPPGRHRLEMRYEPPEVRTGLLVSGLGLLILVALAAFESRRPRASAGA